MVGGCCRSGRLAVKVNLSTQATSDGLVATHTSFKVEVLLKAYRLSLTPEISDARA
jgi:hypothetical protein